jgi:hypothetical protein
MNAWIGPAIVAAVISSIVSAFGWYVSWRTTVGLEKLRRAEKVRDFQIALRAEIRSELHDLRDHDIGDALSVIKAKYAAEPGYSVRIPMPVEHVVYAALTAELHLLPEAVIDPVVLYYRQRATIRQIVVDTREGGFAQLSAEQQLAMYEDYLKLRQYLAVMAEQALEAIDKGLNSPDAGLSGRRSASADPKA